LPSCTTHNTAAAAAARELSPAGTFPSSMLKLHHDAPLMPLLCAFGEKGGNHDSNAVLTPTL